MKNMMKILDRETLRKPHWISHFLKNGYTVEEVATVLEMEIETVQAIQNKIRVIKPLKAYNSSSVQNVCQCGAVIPFHNGICICCGN